MDTSGKVHIKNIVKTAMAMADADEHEYTKYFSLAMRVVRTLRLKYVREGEKIVKLDVNTSLKTVDKPNDMIDYSGLAIVVNGEFGYLTRRDSINPTTTETEGVEGFDTDIGEGEDVVDNAWDGFATRGGINVDGYYWHDYENDRFVLRNVTATKIWLKYTTSGFSLDSKAHYFPVRYEMAIILGTVWMVNMLRKDVAMNFKMQVKQEFEDELMDLKNREWGTLRELSDVFDSLIHNGVRR